MPTAQMKQGEFGKFIFNFSFISSKATEQKFGKTIWWNMSEGEVSAQLLEEYTSLLLPKNETSHFYSEPCREVLHAYNLTL
jgi:hypothetical protein